MRFFGPLLVGLAVASCAISPSSPSSGGQSGTATAANLHAGAAAKLDLAGVQNLVRDRLKGSQVDDIQAEMKDVQWVATNLGLVNNTLPMATPVWVVVAKGQIHGSKDADLTGTLSDTFSNANFVVVADTSEFIKTRLGGRMPTKLTTATLDAAAAEQVIRDHYKTDQLDSVQAELKTFQWASDNLALGTMLYSLDSIAWIVTVKGTIKSDAPPGVAGTSSPTFKTGKFVVAADTGLIVGTTLYPGDFTPQAALPASPQSADTNTFLSFIPPSPHPVAGYSAFPSQP